MIDELTQHHQLAGRIIEEHQQRTRRAAILKPAVLGAIDLYKLAISFTAQSWLIERADIVCATTKGRHAQIAAARIKSGNVFRGIDRWGDISKRRLDPETIYDIVKLRADLPGSIWQKFPPTACAPVFLPTQSTATFPSPKP